jgi:hypothetical protein
MNDLLAMNGGEPRINGGETAWDFGFRMGDAATWAEVAPTEADDTEDGIQISGPKVLLTDYARSLNRGDHLPFNWQLTGSCVNGGAQNAMAVRCFVEAALLPQQAERPEIPFTLFAYGQSRWDAFRDNVEGSGSRGDAMAKAIATAGVLPIDYPGLPVPHICGPCLVYDRAIELRFSAIRNHDPLLRGAAKQHNAKWGHVRGSSDAVAELRKGRPLTWAGDWGGLDVCRVEQGLLLSERANTWQHQQSCLGFWGHPFLGLIFYIQNQWFYPDPAGTCEVEYIRERRGQSISRIITPGNCLSLHAPRGYLPSNGEPIGGYWIREKDMDYQCRTGEVRSFYGFAGFSGLIAPRA